MAKQAKIKGDGRSVGNDKKLKTTLTITFSIISIVDLRALLPNILFKIAIILFPSLLILHPHLKYSK